MGHHFGYGIQGIEQFFSIRDMKACEFSERVENAGRNNWNKRTEGRTVTLFTSEWGRKIDKTYCDICVSDGDDEFSGSGICERPVS